MATRHVILIAGEDPELMHVSLANFGDRPDSQVPIPADFLDQVANGQIREIAFFPPAGPYAEPEAEEVPEVPEDELPVTVVPRH